MIGAYATTPGQNLSPEQLGQLRAQAEDLEGVFLNTLMKEMFASLSSDKEAMGGGFGEDTWRGIQAEQMADAVARAGGIGLADSFMSDLLKLQEASQNTIRTYGGMQP